VAWRISWPRRIPAPVARCRARWAFRFPPGASAFLPDGRAAGFRRDDPTAAESLALPLTLLYPHGRVACLLQVGSAAAPAWRRRGATWTAAETFLAPAQAGGCSPWWVLLVGSRPCDLPAAAEALHQALAAVPPQTAGAAPESDAARLAFGRPARGDGAHNCLLPFVRYPGWPVSADDSCSRPRPNVTGAHRAALAIVLPGVAAPACGPLLPPVWEENAFLRGEMGEYVLVARRAGAVWHVAGITGAADRVLTLWLDFLEPGRRYGARWWCDPLPLNEGRAAGLRTGEFRAGDKPVVALAVDGGFALRLDPDDVEGAP
jgi:hypothetical protein